MTHQIFQLFQGYLAMGLLVGIVGIAVVMVRAVRERRRQIGTLRALGFPAQSVGRSFAIEAGYIALQGTMIGVLLALLTLYTIVARSDAMGDLQFAVPIAQLSILLVATAAASLLATVAPALSATRIRPAEDDRLMTRTSFTPDEARRIGEQIGIDWETAPFDVEQFRMGMDVELEHGLHDSATNVTGDEPVVTGKITLAHLNEFPDYYTRLDRMEEEAKRDHGME